MAARGTNAGAVIQALGGELERRHGISRIYGQATPFLGVLSVAAGLTVRTDGASLRWREGGTTVRWPAADIPGAAVRLAGLAAGPAPGQ
jgi:hypothetical protein